MIMSGFILAKGHPVRGPPAASSCTLRLKGIDRIDSIDRVSMVAVAGASTCQQHLDTLHTLCDSTIGSA